MKKLMSVLLGMSIGLGVVSLFAQDTSKPDDKMTSSSTKKTKAKKTKAPKASKSTDAPKM
jgi:hypothetical protein